MTVTTARLAATFAATAALGLVACGGSTTTPSGSATSAPASPTGEATGASPGTVRKVSANTASEDEIAAALAGAGVPNPKRWAEEVVEYRPYPLNDPKLTKLRTNLAKYNPGEETIDKIVSVLTP
jgi:TRAP-type uncharacterized transport system substrate-binding protein